MEKNTGSRLDEHAVNFPEKAALVLRRGKSNWETIAFKQLAGLADRFAQSLLSLNNLPGKRAAVMIPPSVEFFALAFALLKTGIVPVVVDPAIGLRNVARCLEESKPEIFFGTPLTNLIRWLYGWGKDSVKINLSIPQLKKESPVPRLDLSPPPPDSPAAIIYTSGSTGLPKGAVYTHKNFNAQLEILARTFDIQPDEIDLPAFPLFALIDCLLGVTAVIPDIRFPPPAKIDPRKIADVIERFGVNNMFASPILLDRLADFGIANHVKLARLKRIITAGAPATPKSLERFRKVLGEDAKVFSIYGATESLPNTVIDSNEVLNETRFRSEKGSGVCIGKPVEGACIRTIKISDEEIPRWDSSLETHPGEIGEITVKGGAVTEKYIGAENKNRLAKIKDGDEVVHRMGDLGYFDEQGRLWYCGRKSHRVVISGGVFFTEGIEGIFNAHPQIRRTALVGVNDRLVLWVELEKESRSANQNTIKQELSALAKEHPQASFISTFLFMKNFPTDVRHNSKIIREELTRLARRRLS